MAMAKAACRHARAYTAGCARNRVAELVARAEQHAER